MRRLLGRRAARLEAGRFVVEGPILVREALRSGLTVTDVYVDAAAEDDTRDLDWGATRLHLVAAGVLDRVLSTVTPRPWAALVGYPTAAAAEVTAGDGPVVLLAGVQDPGNVGTVVRAAEAAGAAGVLTLDGTADPFSPKVVRSSAGSVLRVPIAPLADDEVVSVVRGAGRRLVVTAMAGSTGLWDAELDHQCAIVLGNEAAGVAPWLVDAADVVVSIPMRGDIESLNVAMAGTLALFEVARVRAAGRTDK